MPYTWIFVDSVDFFYLPMRYIRPGFLNAETPNSPIPKVAVGGDTYRNQCSSQCSKNKLFVNLGVFGPLGGPGKKLRSDLSADEDELQTLGRRAQFLGKS